MCDGSFGPFGFLCLGDYVVIYDFYFFKTTIDRVGLASAFLVKLKFGKVACSCLCFSEQ